MNNFILSSTHGAIAALTLLLAAIGCGPERSPAPALPVEPLRAAAPTVLPANTIEHIASIVSAAERTQAEAHVAALLARIKNNPPVPRVLFSVPALGCLGGGMKPVKGYVEDCLHARGLFYEPLITPLWGLGSLFVDAGGRFWQSDPVVNRIVAFDALGKRIHSVPLAPLSEGTRNVWHVTADEVRLVVPQDLPQMNAVVRFGFDGTYRGTVPIESTTDDLNWSSLIRLPGEQNRFVSLDYVRSYRVVDANYTGNRVTFSAPSELRLHGHRYGLVCQDSGGAQHGTLVIDNHATAVPGCGGMRHVAADGSAIIEVYPDLDPIPAALHYDSQARLIGVALGGVQEVDLGLGHFMSVAIGPDGKAYSYVARKRRVDFVEVPFVAP